MNLENYKHVYWAAGEPDCAKEIKAPNGEIHTLKCKNCDNPRDLICDGSQFARESYIGKERRAKR